MTEFRALKRKIRGAKRGQWVIDQGKGKTGLRDVMNNRGRAKSMGRLEADLAAANAELLAQFPGYSPRFPKA